MELSENIKLAWEGVRGNLMRSVLTTLGIIIGIASIIAVLSVGTSLEEHLIKTMHEILSPSVNISVGSRDESAENVTIPQNKMITEDMIRLIKARFAGKIKAVGVNSSFVQMKTEGTKPYTIIAMGINPEFADIVKANDIVKGRSLTDDDITRRRKVVLIPDNFAEAYFGKEDPLGKEIVFKTSNGQLRFTVVGVFKALNERLNDMVQVYMPVSLKTTLAADENDRCEGYTSVTAMISEDVTDNQSFVDEVSTFINERYYMGDPNYAVKVDAGLDFEKIISSVMEPTSYAVSAIAGISLLVGGIGVMNIMLVSVTERTREIGIRKALGATNRDIRIQFIFESMILCLIGGTIGMLIGIGLAALAGMYLGFSVHLSLASVIIAVGFSSFISIFFGYYPANKAAVLDPIDALRYE